MKNAYPNYYDINNLKIALYSTYPFSPTLTLFRFIYKGNKKYSILFYFSDKAFSSKLPSVESLIISQE